MSTKEQEIKPCPFCRGELKRKRRSSLAVGSYHYQHPDNGCLLNDVGDFKFSLADCPRDIEQWNKRVEG